MKHTTVFLILDAGRSDYVDPAMMPFLHSVAQDGLSGSFESPPGYAPKRILFSGRYPDTTGDFGAYVYDPEKSPFRWVGDLGPVNRFLRPFSTVHPGRGAIDGITRWKTGTPRADPGWIPPEHLPFFRPVEAFRPDRPVPEAGAGSIFGLCQEHGRRYHYIGAPLHDGDDAVHDELVRALRTGPEEDLYIAQFDTPEAEGRRHGPQDETFRKRHLSALDDRIASIHAALVAGSGSWDLFICGDHGMGTVRERVDILGLLKGLPAVPGEDYVAFVNSTLVSLWYLTPRGRDVLEAALPSVPRSYLLDEADRRRLRIPTDRAWGDRMLAAEAGVLYSPDYFHPREGNLRGMHGWLDKSEESHGMAVLVSSNGHTSPRDIGRRPLADVFPTLCDLIGVRTPDGQEGKSLLEG
ncbi:MAG: alkaline phosphatase family protein [Euryarchaeota archaeon]|nr:alkaline phosphatase family protein [Euryarchaeota archaeon]